MKIFIYSALIFIGILLLTSFEDTHTDEQVLVVLNEELADIPETDIQPPCLKLYHAINEYSEKYDIPKRYAFGIAYKETHYMGPFHWDYKHTQTSYAGAIGPMQIMPATGNMMWGKKVSTKKLMNDIELNVETSMKLLRRLYDKYGNWQLVFGAYNTGQPCVNGYAVDVFNYNYKFVPIK